MANTLHSTECTRALAQDFVEAQLNANKELAEPTLFELLGGKLPEPTWWQRTRYKWYVRCWRYLCFWNWRLHLKEECMEDEPT